MRVDDAAHVPAHRERFSQEVEFVGYPGPLPHGLVLGDTRDAIAKKLGKPQKTYENNDYWQPAKNRRLSCTFARGRLVELYIGRPKDY